MLVSELQELFVTWCKDNCGIVDAKIIWDYQNLPKLPRPYLSLAITSITQFGFNEIREPDDNGIGQIVAQDLMVLRINAYGADDKQGFDAFDILERLKLSTYKESTATTFDEKVAFLSVLSMSNISQIINTGFECRASMDTQWMLATSIEDDVGLIEHVIANGKITNYNGDIIKQVTTEV